jgi:hypothetical protein
MRGHPLTKAQLGQLLAVYTERGIKGARPLAIKFGIAPRYVARVARENGVTNNRARNDCVIMPKSTHEDPRWAWAIQRGSVSA